MIKIKKPISKVRRKRELLIDSIAGIIQLLSGKIFRFTLETEGSTSAAYMAIFLFYASSLLIGLVLYLQAKDRLD